MNAHAQNDAYETARRGTERAERLAERAQIIREAAAKNEAARQARISDRRGVIGD